MRTEVGTGLWLVFGIVVLTVSAVIMIEDVRAFLREKGAGNPYELALKLGATCYPLGVGIKFALIGPQFLRFHLADFGFTMMVTQVLFGMVAGSYSRRQRLAKLNDIEKTHRFIRLRLILVPVALMIIPSGRLPATGLRSGVLLYKNKIIV